MAAEGSAYEWCVDSPSQDMASGGPSSSHAGASQPTGIVELDSATYHNTASSASVDNDIQLLCCDETGADLENINIGMPYICTGGFSQDFDQPVAHAQAAYGSPAPALSYYTNMYPYAQHPQEYTYWGQQQNLPSGALLAHSVPQQRYMPTYQQPDPSPRGSPDRSVIFIGDDVKPYTTNMNMSMNMNTTTGCNEGVPSANDVYPTLQRCTTPNQSFRAGVAAAQPNTLGLHASTTPNQSGNAQQGPLVFAKKVKPSIRRNRMKESTMKTIRSIMYTTKLEVCKGSLSKVNKKTSKYQGHGENEAPAEKTKKPIPQIRLFRTRKVDDPKKETQKQPASKNRKKTKVQIQQHTEEEDDARPVLSDELRQRISSLTQVVKSRKVTKLAKPSHLASLDCTAAVRAIREAARVLASTQPPRTPQKQVALSAAFVHQKAESERVLAVALSEQFPGQAEQVLQRSICPMPNFLLEPSMADAEANISAESGGQAPVAEGDDLEADTEAHIFSSPIPNLTIRRRVGLTPFSLASLFDEEPATRTKVTTMEL